MPLALAHRNHASVRHFALHMLELNGGVIDPKVIMQPLLHIRRKMRSLIEGGMLQWLYGKRAREFPNLCPDAVSCTSFTPSIERMAVSTSSSFSPRGVPSSRIFNVSRTISESRPQNQHANSDGERWVDPESCRGRELPSSCNHRGRGERVANFMEQRAAKVDVASGAVQQSRNRSIHLTTPAAATHIITRPTRVAGAAIAGTAS